MKFDPLNLFLQLATITEIKKKVTNIVKMLSKISQKVVKNVVKKLSKSCQKVVKKLSK
jgi:uncharacterized protein YjgD (DUF1641 family)